MRNTSASLGQYSWNQRTPSPFAAATSSSVWDDSVDKIIGTPSSPAARARASSPSGCRMPCAATGAVTTGAGRRGPSTLVPVVRSVAPVSIRGTMRHRSKAARFARAVAPDPAEPAT